MPSVIVASGLFFVVLFVQGQDNFIHVVGRGQDFVRKAKAGETVQVRLNENEGKEKEAKVSLQEEYFTQVQWRREPYNQQLFWRIHVDLVNDDESDRREGVLSVMIEQGRNTKIFQLPKLRSSAEQLDEEEDTDERLHDRSVDLCPAHGETITKDSTVRIHIVSSALSKSLLKLNVTASLQIEGEGWQKSNWANPSKRQLSITRQFSPKSPLIETAFLYGLLEDTDHYLHLRLESPEDSPCFCSIVSVQRAGCPYHDSIGEAKRIARLPTKTPTGELQGSGQWQTVNRTSSMVIKVSKFVNPESNDAKKLLIVLLGAHPKLCGCKRNEMSVGLSKSVTIQLEPIARNKTRLFAMLLVTGSPLLVGQAKSVV